MSLAGVESALRELILDGTALPGDTIDRIGLFQKRFPNLTSNEVDDLAAILPSQLHVYYRSASAVRLELLEKRFPMSLYALKTFCADCVDTSDFSAYIVQAVHAFKPWKSVRSIDLAESFKSYVTYGPHDLLSHYPPLRALVELEYVSLLLRQAPATPEEDRARNRPAVTSTTGARADWTKPRVMQIPVYISLNSFEYDVVEVLMSFYETGRIPPAIPCRFVEAIGFRNPEGFSRWCKLPRAIFYSLLASPRETPLIVDEFCRATARASVEPISPNVVSDWLKHLSNLGAVVVS